LSGTHLLLAGRMKKVMAEKKLTIPWFVGGNIPAKDIDELKNIGASQAFPTGSKVADVVLYFNTIKVSA
jgi:methylmalonyl-CoA mutase cobalamin-binding domain/chain